VETYARLKPANVFATAELLRLASQIRIKPLHFVSTIAIAADCAEPQLVREDHRFASSSLPPTGYVASQRVAEQLVWTASERGQPVTVHRPGRIAETPNGVTGNDDAFWQLIRHA
jgi:thioester reductase-like protein